MSSNFEPLKMKSYIIGLISVFTSIASLAQTQVGNDINGMSSNDSFGWSVASSGNGQTIVVGAPGSSVNGDSSGQIKIYQFDGTNWNQLGDTLEAYAESNNAGRSVAITDDGTTIAIGIPNSNEFAYSAGSVEIFQFDGSNWIQKGTTLYGSNNFHEFGTKVAISNDGNRIAVGASYYSGINTEAGALKVFDFNSNQWELSFEIEGDHANDLFGSSLDMSRDGNHIICGAWINEDGTTREGYVKIFSFENGLWSQLGDTIYGELPGNFFGAASAISNAGTTIAIGSWGNDENGTDAGEVEVYQLNNNSWQALGMDLQGDGGGQRFGWALELSGDGSVLAVGAYQGNYTKVYKRINDNWIPIGTTLYGVSGNDEFGYSVDLTTDGTKLIVGDPSNDNVASYAGFAQVYDLTNVLSIDTPKKDFVKVYPNPTRQYITVETDVVFDALKLYDISGRLVLEQDVDTSANEVQLDISPFSDGVYLLKIQSQDGISTKRIVKKRN